MKYNIGDIIRYYDKVYIIHSIDLKKDFAYISFKTNSKFSLQRDVEYGIRNNCIIPICCKEMDDQ
jgi:hypothetical protein